MDFSERFQSQIKQFWSQLDTRKRLILAGTLAVLLVGFVALLTWANQTDYAPLYTNLAPETAPEIVEKLKEQKIDYRLSRGGTVIEVPRSQVLDVRLTLASQGIPAKGTVGFEIFDNPSMSATSFVEQLNYQRALQGELERTINEMEMIEATRVLLALPRDTLFVEDQKPPTASVQVKLADGAHLRREQIRAITNLVASAIEGMSPDHVTITDTNGKPLSTPTDDSIAGMPSSILEYQETLERKLEERVTQFLERTAGPGKVDVRIKADLDMTAQEEIQERFDPDSAVARSIQRRTEDREATAPGPEGAPGSNAALPGAAPANVQRNTIGKQDETTNYEIDKTTRKIVEQPGRLSRLSVAVLIDGTYAGEGTARTYTARTAEELAKYEEIVRSAIGYDETRGDVVKIQNIQFHSIEDTLTEADTKLAWQTPARYALMVLGMVLLFFLLRPLIQALSSGAGAGEGLTSDGLLPDGTRPALGAPGDEGVWENGEFDPRALHLPNSQRLLTAGSAERQRREEMVNLARSDMDNTISTLRDWIREESKQQSA